MLPNDFLQQLATRLGASACAIIPASDVRVDDSFAASCQQNRCGCHNANWACPPAQSPDAIRRVLPSFSRCLVFQHYGRLEDCFDFAGMQKAQDAFSILCQALRDSLGPDSLVLGTGPCLRCATCTWPDPCRFPDGMRLNLEALGVDVTALCESANLPYHRPEHAIFTGAALLP